MAIVFKIRRKTDGLFSTGGSSPRFTKIGKLWKQKGHLTNHLNQLDNRPTRNGRRPYDDCEIIPYELVETPAGPGMSIQLYLAEIEQRKKDREEATRKRHEEWQREKRRQEYLKLKAEFGE